MSRRARSRAQRDAARASKLAAHRAKLAAWRENPPALSPRPPVLSFTARGGTKLELEVIPIRFPFDPSKPDPPENLKERVLAAITSNDSGDA